VPTYDPKQEVVSTLQNLLPNVTDVNMNADPMRVVSDMFVALGKQYGLTDTKTFMLDQQASLENVQNERDQKLREAGNDPWLSAAARDKKIKDIYAEYEQKIANRTNILALQEKNYQDIRGEMMNISDKVMQMYGYNQQAWLNERDKQFSLAEKAIAAQTEIALKQMEEDNPDWKVVQGGLIDTKTGKWLVPPQEIATATATANALDALLTPTEAATLGVPYGTTKGEAAGMEITPTKGTAQDTRQTVNSIISGLDNLVKAWQDVPETYRGQVGGRLATATSAKERNTQVAAFESAKSIVGMQLTRLFEQGRISDQDRLFYMSQMPNLNQNNLTVVNASAEQLKKRLLDKIGSVLKQPSGGTPEPTDASVLRAKYGY
jgi:hypothetical protein